MSIPILMMELKGFTRMATQMAYDMETTDITPERVRASGIAIVRDVVERIRTSIEPTNFAHIGGDTWAFEFRSMKDAVTFGWMLLKTFLELVTEKAVFFLKPSLALGVGQPKWQDDRFLDDTSIETYRVADKGRPYHFYLLGDAIGLAKRIDWVRLSTASSAPPFQGDMELLNWQAMVPPEMETGTTGGVFLPTLLLDNEILYANSPGEAVRNFIRQQSRARSVIVFGGPVPYDIPIYREYLRSTLSMLRSGWDCKWTVLAYLPIYEARYSYAWLEMCRWLSMTYPRTFAVAAFVIPENQPRPFSCHIYDEKAVHIGLRSFSPQRGSPTMNSAIIVRSPRIAARFKDEFLENWRRIGPLDESKYEHLKDQFTCLAPGEKEKIKSAVDELHSE
jgi:hypothetical protein